MDFPGGPVVKNPPANAGDTGLSPHLGRRHMPQGKQARAPQLLKPMVSRAHAPQQENPQQREPHAPQLERSPCSLPPGQSLSRNGDPG